MCAPPFGAFHALAVDDTGGRTRLPIDQLTAFLVEFIMDSQQRPVIPPSVGSSRTRCCAAASPWGYSATDTPCSEFTKGHLPPRVHRSRAADHRAWLAGSDAPSGPILRRSDHLDSAFVPVVPRTVLSGPHYPPRESIRHRITAESMGSAPVLTRLLTARKVLGRTLESPAVFPVFLPIRGNGVRSRIRGALFYISQYINTSFSSFDVVPVGMWVTPQQHVAMQVLSTCPQASPSKPHAASGSPTPDAAAPRYKKLSRRRMPSARLHNPAIGFDERILIFRLRHSR